jgi:FMNH2-dependent dimethyl sulfone monooxygenase
MAKEALMSPRDNEAIAEYRRAHVPVFNDQKLKLGLFGMNCSNGLLVSTVPTDYRLTWEHTRQIVQRADRMGFEFALPLGRWRGFGGLTDFNGASFETYTWAAGLAEATKRIMLFATSHVSTIHPVAAAKEAVTIDHISGGRFGINLVMGWFRPEMEMFGGTMLGHDERYAYGAEWVRVVKRIWTEQEPFDFEGKFFQLSGVQGFPKPVQKPHPVLVNAGTSAAAIDFSAREVDICFATLSSPASIAKHVAIKETARADFGRAVGLFASALVVCRDTRAEAERDYELILEHGDSEAAASMMRVLGMESQSYGDRLASVQRRFVAGYGTNPLIGTPEEVVDQLLDYSRRGIDGLALYFIDYDAELAMFDQQVMPLLRQAGLRS